MSNIPSTQHDVCASSIAIRLQVMLHSFRGGRSNPSASKFSIATISVLFGFLAVLFWFFPKFGKHPLVFYVKTIMSTELFLMVY